MAHPTARPPKHLLISDLRAFLRRLLALLELVAVAAYLVLNLFVDIVVNGPFAKLEFGIPDAYAVSFAPAGRPTSAAALLHPQHAVARCESWTDLVTFGARMVVEADIFWRRVLFGLLQLAVSSLILGVVSSLQALKLSLANLGHSLTSALVARLRSFTTKPSPALAAPPTLASLFIPTEPVVAAEYMPEAYAYTESKYLKSRTERVALHFPALHKLSTSTTPLSRKQKAKLARLQAIAADYRDWEDEYWLKLYREGHEEWVKANRAGVVEWEAEVGRRAGERVAWKAAEEEHGVVGLPWIW